MKLFGVVLASALALSAWVGWTRYTLIEPPPVAVLTPVAPVEVNGARFGLVGVSTVPTETAPGSVTVRLDLTEEWAGGAEELACQGWLVAESGRWQNTYSADSKCHDLEAGQRRRLSFSWEVPDGVQPTEFQLRFGSTARLAIRP